MALLIIPVLKRWSRARGPYGYLRTWNWPITARKISQPYNKIYYILVMQCFRVGYRGICHASLVFSVYTRAFRRVCIRRKYKWQVACSTVSHEKALHNYFIPCLNLRKTYGNFGKSSEISANFRKLQKRLKPVFEELSRFQVFSRCFYDFLKFSEYIRKSSEVFGNLRKFSETVQK